MGRGRHGSVPFDEKAQDRRNGGQNGENRDRDVSVRVPRWRPPEKFVIWIRAYKILCLSRSINVQRSTIYDWIHGVRPPLEENARAIAVLSQHFPEGVGPLGYEDIFGPLESA